MARLTWKEWCISSLCLHEENCRGGTEVFLKITCDVEEKRLFEKALMWPLWKEVWYQNKRNKWEKEKEEWRRCDQVGVTMTWPSQEDAHTTDRRTLQLFRWLTVSPMVTCPDAYDGRPQRPQANKVRYQHIQSNCHLQNFAISNRIQHISSSHHTVSVTGNICPVVRRPSAERNRVEQV